MAIPVYRLGLKRSRPDPRTLRAEQFISLPRAPDTVNYQSKTPKWEMYANDQIGDCGPAAAAHAITTMSSVAEKNAITLSEASVIDFYKRLSGWDGVPGSDTDTGVMLLDMLKLWQKEGIGGRKIVAYFKINHRDHEMTAKAIEILGSVIHGVALPLGVQGEEEWLMPRPSMLHRSTWQPWSWGGHAICEGHYDPHWRWPISWGREMKMAWAFADHFIDETFGVVTEEWIDDFTGRTPTGFDLDGLLKAAKQLQ